MTEKWTENNAQGITNPLVLTLLGDDKTAEKLARAVFLKRLFTVEEAAAYLGRGIDSVREMIWRHEIQIVQRGDRGKIWLDVEDLGKWIKENKRMAGCKSGS